MNYKQIAAGLLFFVTACSSLGAQDDFFRCAFLSRAEIAFNAAVNGDLTEEMVADLPSEDRAQLIVSINDQIARRQSDVLTDAQQTWNTAGIYAVGGLVAASGLVYAYHAWCVNVHSNSWFSHANEAWACEDDKEAGWQDEQAKHLRKAAKFRWQTGRSALIVAGAFSAQAAAGFLWNVLQNRASNHEDALLELEHLQGSLELINSVPVVA